MVRSDYGVAMRLRKDSKIVFLIGELLQWVNRYRSVGAENRPTSGAPRKRRKVGALARLRARTSVAAPGTCSNDQRKAILGLTSNT
jgi:hypothetical protein